MNPSEKTPRIGVLVGERAGFQPSGYPGSMRCGSGSPLSSEIPGCAEMDGSGTARLLWHRALAP